MKYWFEKRFNWSASAPSRSHEAWGMKKSFWLLVTTFRLAAGEFHTCGIRFDDKVVCWGDNYDGQVGRAPPGPETCIPGSGDSCSTTPRNVSGL